MEMFKMWLLVQLIANVAFLCAVLIVKFGN